jgi:hypothetical protein
MNLNKFMHEWKNLRMGYDTIKSMPDILEDGSFMDAYRDQVNKNVKANLKECVLMGRLA